MLALLTREGYIHLAWLKPHGWHKHLPDICLPSDQHSHVSPGCTGSVRLRLGPSIPFCCLEVRRRLICTAINLCQSVTVAPWTWHNSESRSLLTIDTTSSIGHLSYKLQYVCVISYQQLFDLTQLVHSRCEASLRLPPLRERCSGCA